MPSWSTGPPARLALVHDDPESVSHAPVQYGWGERPGPVAIVVDTALNLDMAVLMKQKVGNRPFRMARDWLASYADRYRELGPDDSFPTVGGWPRSLRAS